MGDFMMLCINLLSKTYANQDLYRWKLQHSSARPYTMIEFCGPYAVQLELLADMTMHDTVDISRLKMYTADQVWEQPPSPPVRIVRDKVGTIQCSYDREVNSLNQQALGIKRGYKNQINW